MGTTVLRKTMNKTFSGALVLFALASLQIFGQVAPTNVPGANAGTTAVACTILTPSPIQAVGPDGTVTGITRAVVGKSYQCLRVENGYAVLEDENKNTFKIVASAVSQTPAVQAAAPASNAAATTTPAPSSTTVPPQPASDSPAANAVPPSPTATSPAAAPATGTSYSSINSLVGLPLFSQDNFWQEDTDDIAKRLHLRRESTTSVERSFRRYGHGQLLGATAYSIALYGKNDGEKNHPTYLSIIFNNAGDFVEGTGNLEDATKKDQKAINDTLTSLLGNPVLMPYGNSSDDREDVWRWDYQGTSFLLTAHNKDYVSLKIVPVSVADNHGIVAVTPRDEVGALLAKRVVTADNGDVTLADIPMVDQGPHGYCVPATWERYLRYVDVPADLYELAQLGHSSSEQGTSVDSMTAGIDGYVSAYHRRIESGNGDDDLDIGHLGRFINKGLPLMWGCFVTEKVEEMTAAHTKARASVTDWDAYGQLLRADDAKLGSGFVARESNGVEVSNGHMRMIVGYNPKTQEIATSDSWGNQAQINWIYLPTAKRISENFTQYVSW